MNSALVPFDEILEMVSDDTGYVNMRPFEERIRRFIFRAEKKIGYSGALILKKISYEVDGTNYINRKRLWLPKDWIELAGLYDGNDKEILSRNYHIQGDWVIFCGPDNLLPEKVTVYYYGLLCDGMGNPCVTRNHQEAVVAYIVWKLYHAKAYLEPARHSRRLVRDYEQTWKDERDAAQGDDAWPQNQSEWNQITNTLNMSSSQLFISDLCRDIKNMCVMQASEKCSKREVKFTYSVYHWQYSNLTTNISIAPTIDQSYLDDIATKETIQTMIEGKVISYTNIGRIAFAVQGGLAGSFRIYDVLNQDITDVVFDKYYNDVLKLDIYISKEFYSHSNMFIKFKTNL